MSMDSCSPRAGHSQSRAKDQQGANQYAERSLNTIVETAGLAMRSLKKPVNRASSRDDRQNMQLDLTHNIARSLV